MSVCPHCTEGFVIVCPDDICRAQDVECIHGDGLALCWYCKGDYDGGDPDDECDDDWPARERPRERR